MTAVAPLPGSLGNPSLNYHRGFEDLAKRVREAGLLQSRPGFYVGWMVANALLLASGWTAAVIVGDSWWALLVAVYLAFFYGQTGLVGHDIGHRQVFRSRKVTDACGYLHGNLVTGVSYGWWVNHHNRHHSNPNHLDMDPDILRRQVIFSTSQLASRQGVMSRFIIRHQAWMFFALILLEGFRLHLAGYVAALKGGIKRNRRLDLSVLSLHLICYGTVVFWLMSPLLAVCFILVHQLLFGLYMGLLFAPNHKGLPVRGGETEELDWARRQVITSRNLISSRVVDYAYGGLNYQIEHHLFPTMPSINLRRVRPIVMDFCRDYELPYVEVSLSQSYREVSRFLGEVSDQSAPLMVKPARAG